MYALCYIVALLLLIFAQIEVLTYIGILFVGFGIGGLLNLMASLVIAVYGAMTSWPPTPWSPPSPL